MLRRVTWASPAGAKSLPQGGLGGGIVNDKGDPMAVAVNPEGQGGGALGSGGGGSDLKCRSWMSIEDDASIIVHGAHVLLRLIMPATRQLGLGLFHH